VQLRTLGLARAALASWRALDAETKGMLQAYANGVNAWLASNPLPPEYGGLEITRVDPWTPLDSVLFAKLMTFQLSFDLDIPLTIKLGTYQGYGAALGFDGTALFFEDTHRSQPTDGRVSVPGFLGSIGGLGQSQSRLESGGAPAADLGKAVAAMEPVSETTLELAVDVFEKFAQSPLLRASMQPFERKKGSNEWAQQEFTSTPWSPTIRTYRSTRPRPSTSPTWYMTWTKAPMRWPAHSSPACPASSMAATAGPAGAARCTRWTSPTCSRTRC
jgi:penicillin amidase